MTLPNKKVVSLVRRIFDDSQSSVAVSKVLNNSHMGDIELRMRSKLANLITNYEDSFNWGIYDEIASRYGNEQPRGGVVFGTTFKLVNEHASCAKCHYSFEIDSYGRGCVHNCAYCYAKDQLTAYGYWNRPMPFPVDLAEVRKTFHTVFETDRPHKWRSTMQKRIPLRIGSMSDSFMWMDHKYKVTQELLKILAHYEYPHVVFTRSDLAAHDDYLRLFKHHLTSIQFSISGSDDRITKLVEPGAPNLKRRLAALKKINDAGIWTTVRLNPFFPTHPDGYFTDPESIVNRFGSKQAAPEFNWFDWELIDHIAETGTPGVLAGVVRLSPGAIKTMSQLTGVDLKAFFKPELLTMKGDKRFSDSEIGYYYKELAKKCKSKQMRFSTCYIGNGEKDYYQYQNLWSNKRDCCDIVGNVETFGTTAQSLLDPKPLSASNSVTHGAAPEVLI